ncbi:hypothetical protein GJ496_007041 [Pomphorhynchus laevis]|nr:hypothetical protein GJ496_003646 [Pomphorhynchus laevis]KAI0984036.1 hypothetical protein GJ496_007041 [Pomphorhynchus laevis]
MNKYVRFYDLKNKNPDGHHVLHTPSSRKKKKKKGMSPIRQANSSSKVEYANYRYSEGCQFNTEVLTTLLYFIDRLPFCSDCKVNFKNKELVDYVAEMNMSDKESEWEERFSELKKSSERRHMLKEKSDYPRYSVLHFEFCYDCKFLLNRLYSQILQKLKHTSESQSQPFKQIHVSQCLQLIASNGY